MEKDEKAGFKPSNHHKYRVFRFVVIIPYGHTFATLALQNGVDVKTVSSMLGHYSAGFTLDTYTHITTKMQQEAADKMGGFMDAAMPEETECKIISFEQVG